MKLIIAGSRTFTDYQLLCQTLALERSRITQVITGGARGADQLGYRWAWKHQVKHQLFRADWERFGKVRWVAYLSPADNVLGPLSTRLRYANQPVISPRDMFSTPRPSLLASL
jgi:hypothetical protein